MNMNLHSPITGLDNVVLINEFCIDELVRRYKKIYKIDIYKKKKSDVVQLYECSDTKYKFYYPFELAGDGSFYSQLAANAPYYHKKKEHKTVLNRIPSGINLFEFGCGNGNFLRSCKNKGINTLGIDINEQAVNQIANENVMSIGLKEYASGNHSRYDIVVSFQVLEHVVDVQDTLNQLLKLLKKNGKLILSVPNNASFIKHAKWNLLNLPPHHMGLWYPETFKYIQNYYPLVLEDLILEELQPIHYKWYANVFLQQVYDKFGIAGKVSRRILSYLLSPCVATSADTITGHSMIAFFKKVDS